MHLPSCIYFHVLLSICVYDNIALLHVLQGPELGNAEVVCQADKGQLITSGGGFSTYYSTPSYQTSAVAAYFSAAASAGQSPVAGYKRTGRGFPDLRSEERRVGKEC